ncbi:hypothetical protein LEP1GSC125_0796 [Leptospira mayottensis 200901122]|uniref:Uncharacterized protein n=1 Tax=Leptospira mayottensis 200901122 TaxID=1193010 RepID=A0AA87T096_9LEPT|nr:hypothetical protein LEP1GSC125_0796 [Leptospira mayottensis 200901122]
MNLHSQDSNTAIREFKSFLKSELSSAEIEIKKRKTNTHVSFFIIDDIPLNYSNRFFIP